MARKEIVTCEGVIIRTGYVLRSLVTDQEYVVLQNTEGTWVALVEHQKYAFPIDTGEHFSFVCQNVREKM